MARIKREDPEKFGQMDFWDPELTRERDVSAYESFEFHSKHNRRCHGAFGEWFCDLKNKFDGA
jgi:hypothetical protein